MYCTRCGRLLSQDGSPCVCGSGQADRTVYETEKTFAVHEQKAENFGETPFMYGQPVYEQPMPVYAPPTCALRQNPLLEPIRSAAASPVFFLAALFMTVNLALSAACLFVPIDYYAFFSSIAPLFDVIQPGMGSEFMREMESAFAELYAAQMQSVLSGIPGLVVSGLTDVSLWMIFASAKKPGGPRTGGLSILHVLQVIGVIVLSLCTLACVILSAAITALVPTLLEEIEYYGIRLSDGARTAAMALAIVRSAAVILGAVLALVFTAKSLSSVVRTKRALRTGVIHKGASRYVAVICFITAAVNMMNAYGTVQLFGVLYGIGCVAAALANLFIALTVIRYNKAVKPYLTPKHSVQPDYPPYGPDSNY